MANSHHQAVSLLLLHCHTRFKTVLVNIMGLADKLYLDAAMYDMVWLIMDQTLLKVH